MKVHLLRIQTGYYLVTALWALIDIESFLKVTGPKTDIWLVKTVAVLLLAICACFITHLLTGTDSLPAPILGAACPTGLLVIDCHYALNDVISDIYLADAFVEFVILIGWTIIFIKSVKGGR